MPFSIERNDLATMCVDAIVVAANEDLQITGGVGASVARIAGFHKLQAACDEIGHCPTGSAVVTPGFDLNARFVVHVVGPVWTDGTHGERLLLRKAYDSALICAAEVGAHSVALPLVSAGTYGFPAEVSCMVALDAVKDFLQDHEMDVKLVLYNRAALVAGLALYGEIAEYIDDRYIDLNRMRNWVADDAKRRFASSAPTAMQGAPRNLVPGAKDNRRRLLSRLSDAIADVRDRKSGRSVDEEDALEKEEVFFSADEAVDYAMPMADDASERASFAASTVCNGAMPCAAAPDSVRRDAASDRGARSLESSARASSLADWLDTIDEPFSTTLLTLIDARGLTDAQVYKRANMSRQLFSKIRSDAAYRPTKKTVLALAVALELDMNETSDLLRRAGFALSNSSKADLIVEYHISRGNYDIFAINEALYAFDQPLL